MKKYRITAAGLLSGLLLCACPMAALADTPVLTAGAGQAASGSMGPSTSFGIQTGPGIGPGYSGQTVQITHDVPDPIVPIVEKYSYDQMVKDLNTLQSRYGAHLRVGQIGTSLDGRGIYEAVLGNPDAPKHILIHGGIHGREYMTPLLVMKQLEYGAELYDTGTYEGETFASILNNVAVHFVPMVNPDGISISQFGLNGLRSEELRQAVQQSYANDIAAGRTDAAFDRYLIYWKANGRGVDLNQNFPANWDQVVSSEAPSYGTYKGPSAFSEPESQVLANLINSRTWAATISYHSMGNIIYWDYPGNQVQQASGELATVISQMTGYRPEGSSGNGGFKDWTQTKENPIPGLTIEVGGVACPLPLTEYMDIWNRNKQVWILAAKYAMIH